MRRDAPLNSRVRARRRAACAAFLCLLAGNKFTVEYSGFVDDDGESMSESGLERKRLRLAPPAAEKGWEPVVGEIVEVRAPVRIRRRGEAADAATPRHAHAATRRHARDERTRVGVADGCGR